MLRALLLPLMNLALAAMATAQTNLVVNPSFEDTTHCLGWPPPKVEALHWYTANTATPDIWNCDLANPCGYHVMDPDNPDIQLQGYKPAYDGDRFAGGFQWYGPGSSNTRDYLTARLLQSLQAGVSYRVSMYCARPTGVNGAVDHIGVHFGPDSIHAPFPTTLPIVPQARLRSGTTQYLVDTDWVELADTIQATGNEVWITFGTFEDADDVDGIWLGWGGFPPAVYYYMDLVSVVAITDLSVGQRGSMIEGLIVQGSDIVWASDLPLEGLIMFDGSGRTVKTWGFTGARSRIPIPVELPAGVYIAAAMSANGRQAVRFVK